MAAFASRYALISVADKDGIIELASKLALMGFQIISTGGTAKHLESAGINTIDVSNITSIPEMLGGRVKTLNNWIYAGILAKRSGSQAEEIRTLGIKLIDIVVVNLYPFEKTIASGTASLEDAIENIDVGGVSLLRASAKNYQSVWSVSNPSQYDKLITGLGLQLDGIMEQASSIRREFAIASLCLTSQYDSMISKYLAGSHTSDAEIMPQLLDMQFTKVQAMRYGENSHLAAGMYRKLGASITGGITNAIQKQGKELSYNNIADADAALKCCDYIAKQFPGRYVCVIVKHANPCGVALGASYLEAYEKAFKADPISAFGGIIALGCSENIPLDGDTASRIVANQFVEVVIGCKFATEALAAFSAKGNVRVLDAVMPSSDIPSYEIKTISGNGILYQETDMKVLGADDFKVVSARQPTASEIEDMRFAWSVAKYVKSNAIVFVKDGMTYGIGAGQMSRLDSAKIAVQKAKEFGFDLNGTIAASDGFYPKADTVEHILDNGITTMISPGGSIRDQEVIDTVNQRNAVMVFTGVRCFLH
jgi:phosphoribosylaminoimidazolecarboxamide formyltransferase/IMP cyclohydrolase